jgi:hypothetical protein
MLRLKKPKRASGRVAEALKPSPLGELPAGQAPHGFLSVNGLPLPWPPDPHKLIRRC